jgi:hypothetical protein
MRRPRPLPRHRALRRAAAHRDIRRRLLAEPRASRRRHADVKAASRTRREGLTDRRRSARRLARTYAESRARPSRGGGPEPGRAGRGGRDARREE